MFCRFTSRTITPVRFTGWPKISTSTSRARSSFSTRTATRPAFSIPIKFAVRFETSRRRRLDKRCLVAGAAKVLFNASTGSSRSCQPRLPKSFGCRPRNFLRTRSANADKKQQRYSTATSKQRRGNRDHYVKLMSSPISKTFRTILVQPSRWLSRLTSIISPPYQRQNKKQPSRGSGIS